MAKKIEWTPEMLSVVEDYFYGKFTAKDAGARAGVSQHVMSAKCRQIYGERARKRVGQNLRSQEKTKKKEEKTHTPPKIMSKKERANIFGQVDHFADMWNAAKARQRKQLYGR